MNQSTTGAGRALAATILIAALPAAGCASARIGDVEPKAATAKSTTLASQRALALDRSRTRPLGHGGRFRPVAISTPVRAHSPVGWLRCGLPSPHPYGAHIELFAEGHEIVIPAGIGIAPPHRRTGAIVDRGACTYQLRTTDPTGVILIDPGAMRDQPTVGDLFKLWGQPLSTRHMAGFLAIGRRRVAAFVNGRRVPGSPSAIRLRRHTQIVIEVGPYVAPHPSYRFAPGL
jgi:hypothetical protein